MATLTPLTVGNAAGTGLSGVPWDSAPNGALGDNSDSTFGYVSTNASGTYDELWELGDVDSDFGTILTLSVVLRYRWTTAASGSDWNELSVRIMDSTGAVVLAAANSGGSFQVVATTITTTTITDSSSTAFAYVNTTATKAQWDGARAEIRIIRTRIKAGGTQQQAVYEADFTGTYTPGSTNTTVTPSTLALVTSSFAPTVTASDHKTATPPTLALVLSTFAPTVTASDHKTATPPTLALVTTRFAPTVTASDHKIATPPTLALVLGAFAPTVTASDHKTATPPTASLVLTTFAPTVTASDHKTATPPTLALVLSTFAPDVPVSDNQVAVPGVVALVLSTFAPTVTASDNQIATPTTLALVLTTFAPTVSASDPQLVTPPLLALVLTTFAPTVTGTGRAPVDSDSVFVPVSGGSPLSPGVPVPGPYAALPSGSAGGFLPQDSVVYGPSTKAGEGVLEPLAPSPIPVRESSTGSRTEELNSRGVENFELSSVGHTEASLHRLARSIGAIYCVGAVSSTSDTRIPHNAGRIPSVIVMSVALNGSANRVVGHPSGGGGSINVARWTTTELFVRAQADGEYAFLVL